MTTTTSQSSTAASALSRLYAARFLFALIWAVTVLASASEMNGFVGALLVLYPVYDIIALLADARLSGKAPAALTFNVVASAVAAIGLGVAATSGIPATLTVFGVWAIVSGVSQLVVGRARHSLGGQLPMVLSGSISVLAGATFIAQATGDDPSLSAVGGYALVGGLFFLASSILLRRQRTA